MFNYDEDKYHANLLSTSVPAALWEQLQEINAQRDELRAAILKLVDDRQHNEMLVLLNGLERLTIQWHRMNLDVTAGIEAVRSAPIAKGV